MPFPSDVRPAAAADLRPLATLWFAGWQDAHVGILPKDLARHRTLESFRERLEATFDQLRVFGPFGDPHGFALLKRDELNQLYVDERVRGRGIAQVLIADAEAALAAQGVRTAWLACAIGNDRAARFYEKSGWSRAGVMTSRLEVPTGILLLDVWRYEKRLNAPDRACPLPPRGGRG